MRIPHSSLLVLLLAVTAAESAFALRIWPTGLCTTTLQACIDGAPDDELIQIDQLTPIAENLVINKPLTLEPLLGKSATLAAGFGISGTLNRSTEAQLDINRLRLHNGTIDLSQIGTGLARINVRHCALTADSGGITRIRVLASGSGQLVTNIQENRFEADAPSLFDALIDVEFASSGANNSGRIEYNTLRAINGGDGWGIFAGAIAGAQGTYLIHGNKVFGRFSRAGVMVSEGYFSSTPSTLAATVLGNVVVGANTSAGSGVSMVRNNGAINVRVLNNTVLRHAFGLIGSIWSGAGAGAPPTTLLFANNLTAFNQYGINVHPDLQPGFTELSNLVHGNPLNVPSAHASRVTGNPLIADFRHPDVAVGSPAIDTGSLSLPPTTLPIIYTTNGIRRVDAAGLRRFKDDAAIAQVDIGAYEFGDQFGTAANPDSSGTNSSFAIGDPAIPVGQDQVVLRTLNAGPTGNLISHGHADGVWYSAPFFLPGGGFIPAAMNLFLQDTGQDMPFNVAYNLLAAKPRHGAFQHIKTDATLYTVLDNEFTNAQPNAVLAVTQNWNPAGGTAVYNNSQIEISYDGPSTRWRIHNANGGNIPSDAGFNVLATDPNPNAFVLEAHAGNILGSTVRLDHPLLNGVACARFLVTPVDGPFGDSAFDVYFAADNSWRIFRYAGAMPVGAKFHVLVDAKRSELCAGPLLKDGFE